MRTEILRRTPLRKTYHDAERTLVTEIGLHGPFYQVPEVLYFRRDPSWLWAAGHARNANVPCQVETGLVRTLDKNNKNRGLQFDAEMLRYCGQHARVLRRVDHVIEEATGKMMPFPNDCIILDDVTCCSEYYGFCPRSIYPYWREIWLKRVE